MDVQSIVKCYKCNAPAQVVCRGKACRRCFANALLTKLRSSLPKDLSKTRLLVGLSGGTNSLVTLVLLQHILTRHFRKENLVLWGKQQKEERQKCADSERRKREIVEASDVSASVRRCLAAAHVDMRAILGIPNSDMVRKGLQCICSELSVPFSTMNPRDRVHPGVISHFALLHRRDPSAANAMAEIIVHRCLSAASDEGIVVLGAPAESITAKAYEHLLSAGGLRVGSLGTKVEERIFNRLLIRPCSAVSAKEMSLAYCFLDEKRRAKDYNTTNGTANGDAYMAGKYCDFPVFPSDHSIFKHAHRSRYFFRSEGTLPQELTFSPFKSIPPHPPPAKMSFFLPAIIDDYLGGLNVSFPSLTASIGRTIDKIKPRPEGMNLDPGILEKTESAEERTCRLCGGLREIGNGRSVAFLLSPEQESLLQRFHEEMEDKSDVQVSVTSSPLCLRCLRLSLSSGLAANCALGILKGA